MSPTVKGIPASEGIAFGPVLVYRAEAVEVPTLTVAHPGEEVERFHLALTSAKQQIGQLETKTRKQIGDEEAAIFKAHQMFLEDPDLIGGIIAAIEKNALNAEAAVQSTFEAAAAQLEGLEDEYFKARAADVRDVSRRIIRILLGLETSPGEFPQEPVIILAEDLTPSDTLQFDKSNILGFATVKGGPTSHTAILARSLGIPAVVSLPVNLADVEDGKPAVLDGRSGEVTINAGKKALSNALAAQKAWRSQQSADLASSAAPAVTRDGHRVEIAANIGGIEDAHQAIEHGAEGVGLFRTEFLYLDRRSMPSEDEQAEAYTAVFETVGKRPVVVRTLDIGGDKAVPYIGFPEEANPFLGWRAVRMSAEHPEVLVSQFRALLRAGRSADLRIMVPMVSQLAEVERARALLAQAQESLDQQGVPRAKTVQFGIMVEVPSAALIADQIAPHVDFFSIGTNDLTQYTLAVDRTNERVAALASPFHPAVLRLIESTIQAAHAHGKWVGLCGEFAGDPLAAPVLLGLGLDEFSMAPALIPKVKALIRRLNLAECREIARHVLSLPSAEDVRQHLETIAAHALQG